MLYLELELICEVQFKHLKCQMSKSLCTYYIIIIANGFLMSHNFKYFYLHYLIYLITSMTPIYRDKAIQVVWKNRLYLIVNY